MDFEGLSDEDILRLHPQVENEREGHSRLVTDMMAILQRQQQIRMRRLAQSQEAPAVTGHSDVVDAALHSAEAFDTVIDRTELGFANLHQRLLTLPETQPSRLLRDEQYSPFEFAAINRRENPHRNMAKLRYWSRRGGPNAVEMSNRKFFYDRLEAGSGPALLAFDPPSRRVQVPDSFDPESDFFLMALYHEIRHALQDNILRMQFADRYAELTQPNTVILDFEEEAYAYMFEQMDRLAGGRLRTITPGSFPAQQELDELNRIFAVPDALRAQVKNIYYLAGCYFDSSAPNTGPFPARFTSTIANTFRGRQLLRLGR